MLEICKDVYLINYFFFWELQLHHFPFPFPPSRLSHVEKIVYMTSIFLNYSHMNCDTPWASLENDRGCWRMVCTFLLAEGSLFIFWVLFCDGVAVCWFSILKIHLFLKFDGLVSGVREVWPNTPTSSLRNFPP